MHKKNFIEKVVGKFTTYNIILDGS